MRFTAIVFYLGLMLMSLVQAQYMTEVPHETSKYYKEMFPPNIDSVKLLVVLPTKLSRAEVDTLAKGQLGADVNKMYEYHLKTTDEIVANVLDHIKKYQINCDIVYKDAYNLEAYPASKYPLVVYPDSMLVDRYLVTFGYHIHDMVHRNNYGYLMGADPDFDNKYFKQLATYIDKLKEKKVKLGTGAEASLKAETKIYKSQKRNKILTNYVALPLVFVAAIGGFLFLLTQ